MVNMKEIVLTARDHHLIKADNVLMPEGLQQFNFPHCSNREAILFGLHTYSFQGNMTTVQRVQGLVDLSKGPLTDLVNNPVKVFM